MQHEIKIFLKIFAIASPEIRRVSELLAMATNGRRAKSPNTIV